MVSACAGLGMQGADVVAGLLEKTEHPGERLKSLHGTLRHVRCTACEYNVWIERADEIPFLEALAGGKTELHTTKLADLPHCPKCAELLRPGVVWFGEELAAGAPDCIDDWVEEEHVDVVISVGTSLEVYPAAEWVETTRALGAVLAVIDTQENHRFADDADWFFHGDVAEILPQILEHLTREQHR
jgi:NAD-dependent deacetylase sirtuin 5